VVFFRAAQPPKSKSPIKKGIARLPSPEPVRRWKERKALAPAMVTVAVRQLHHAVLHDIQRLVVSHVVNALLARFSTLQKILDSSCSLPT
jgi:hypothetical protein